MAFYNSVKLVTVKDGKDIYKSSRGARFNIGKNDYCLSMLKCNVKDLPYQEKYKQMAEAFLSSECKWVDNGKQEYFNVPGFYI